MIAHDGVLEHIGEVPDAALHLGLLVLGRVVATVLFEIALFAGDLDAFGNLGASHRGQLL